MTNFRVGQKVVCVPVGPGIGGCLELIRDKVVTVLAVGHCHGPLVGVYVDGIATTCRDCGKRLGGEMYSAVHFRSIDELEDQIERIEKEGVPAELLEEMADHLEPAYAMN